MNRIPLLESVGKLCGCEGALPECKYMTPKPCLRQKNAGGVASWEGVTKSSGFRLDSAPHSLPTPSQNRSRLKERWSPTSFPHFLGGPGVAWSRGRPGRAGRGRPLPCGSVLSACEGLKGPRGGVGGPVLGGGAAHQSGGAVSMLLFLLALLPSL